MKKLLTLGAAAAAALAMTGCASVNTNDAAIHAHALVKPQEFKADIVAQETKVTGEASVNALFGFITWGVSEYADEAFTSCSNNSLCIASPATVAKQGATYQACQKAKADYILGAKYKVDTKDYFVFKQVKCTVTGYPASLKGVK